VVRKKKNATKDKADIRKSRKNETLLYVPAMVLAEVGYLSERRRIEIRLDDIAAYLTKYGNILTHAMDTELVRTAFEINDIPELHDRRIAATGRLLGYKIITNDPHVAASKFVSTIWD